MRRAIVLAVPLASLLSHATAVSASSDDKTASLPSDLPMRQEGGGTRRTPKAPPDSTRVCNSRSVWSAAYPAAFAWLGPGLPPVGNLTVTIRPAATGTQLVRSSLPLPRGLLR